MARPPPFGIPLGFPPGAAVWTTAPAPQIRTVPFQPTIPIPAPTLIQPSSSPAVITAAPESVIKRNKNCFVF